MPDSTPLIRHCPLRELPPYSYVPGLFPHPISDPNGHLFGRTEPHASPLGVKDWRENETWLYALDLFNQGYYWEAHEAWESLWHASGRQGRTADLLKGLIKLAAAGVKAREGRQEGVRRHARRAAELFGSAGEGQPAVQFGVSIDALIELSSDIQRRAAELVSTSSDAVVRVLPPIELRTGDA